MTGKWFPIPGYSRYEASWDGQIRNRKTGRSMKTFSSPANKNRQRITLRTDADRKMGNSSVARFVLAAKLGRPLEPWEHACHGPGGSKDDSMANLTVGCVINNTLDDIESGARQSSPEELRRALGRIQALLASVSS